jgi:hypothetical protein
MIKKIPGGIVNIPLTTDVEVATMIMMMAPAPYDIILIEPIFLRIKVDIPYTDHIMERRTICIGISSLEIGASHYGASWRI